MSLIQKIHLASGVILALLVTVIGVWIIGLTLVTMFRIHFWGTIGTVVIIGLVLTFVFTTEPDGGGNGAG